MTFYGMLHNLAKSFPEERKVLDQWVFVLDRWVFVLDQWVFVLDQWVFVLDHRVFVLDHRVFVLDQLVFGLRFWDFVLDTSISIRCFLSHTLLVLLVFYHIFCFLERLQGRSYLGVTAIILNYG